MSDDPNVQDPATEPATDTAVTPSKEEAASDQGVQATADTDTEDEPEVFEIPTGERLVSLSALTAARAKAKDLRERLGALEATAGKSQEKDAEIAQLQQQLQQILPMAQAYQTALQAQQHTPAQPSGPPTAQNTTPEELAKLQRVAQQLDFYKGDALDLERAQAHLALLREEAQAIADARVQPFQAQSLHAQADLMFQRASITRSPDGYLPDPQILRQVWSTLDPQITSTPNGAAHAWTQALGMTIAAGRGKPAAQPVPAPILSEPAGGRDVPVSASTLTENDRRVMRDLGMSEKDYLAEVATMPKGWGKHQ